MRARTKVCVVLFLISAAIILLRPITDFFTPQNRLPGNNVEGELSPERIQIMSPDKLVNLLNLPAGSTVLDLGAGFGMYSFRLGRAVGSAGKIFATDVDAQAIDYLNGHALKEGVANVVPVKVSGHGLDSFYREHTFDLILASDVITEIRAPEAFFDELRPSLREGTGRMWIVTMRPDPDFTVVEFGDPSTLQRSLQSGERQSAIVRRLSVAARQALAAQPTTVGPEQVASLVIDDLNKLLEDPTLWRESQENKWPLNQQDANFRNVLAELLDKKGVTTFQSGVRDDTRRVLRLLNRLLILDLMDSSLWSKAVALNTLSNSQLKRLLVPLTLKTPDGRPAFLDNAGYEVVQEHKSIPYCYIWEYKRKR